MVAKLSPIAGIAAGRSANSTVGQQRSLRVGCEHRTAAETATIVTVDRVSGPDAEPASPESSHPDPQDSFGGSAIHLGL
jgi:hypothetical protein